MPKLSEQKFPRRKVLAGAAVSNAVQDYAKAIWSLAQRGDLPVSISALADRLEVSPASVRSPRSSSNWCRRSATSADGSCTRERCSASLPGSSSSTRPDCW